jgi:hypothetical protein
MAISQDVSGNTHETENELERLLRLSVQDIAYRPAFYQALLNAQVWVLGDAAVESQLLSSEQSPDKEWDIIHWEKQDGSSIIPFFSSLAALHAATAPTSPELLRYFSLSALLLLKITQGELLFLNPKLEYGKEFYPQEITGLLTQGGLNSPQEMVLEQNSEIWLGQPSEYPTAMVTALTTLFSQKKPIRRAFLALFHDKQQDPHPNLLVGLEVDGDEAEIEQIIREAGSVASEVLEEEQWVDFCLVAADEPGISHYLQNHTQPFYQRKWGSWLRESIPASQA